MLYVMLFFSYSITLTLCASEKATQAVQCSGPLSLPSFDTLVSFMPFPSSFLPDQCPLLATKTCTYKNESLCTTLERVLISFNQYKGNSIPTLLRQKAAVHEVIVEHVLNSERDCPHRLHAFFQLQDLFPESAGLYLRQDKIALITTFAQQARPYFTASLVHKGFRKLIFHISSLPQEVEHSFSTLSFEEKNSFSNNLIALISYRETSFLKSIEKNTLVDEYDISHKEAALKIIETIKTKSLADYQSEEPQFVDSTLRKLHALIHTTNMGDLF